MKIKKVLCHSVNPCTILLSGGYDWQGNTN
jgi:hypothetical protein